MFKLLVTTVRDVALNGTSVHTLVIELPNRICAQNAFNAIEQSKDKVQKDTGAYQTVVKLYE